MCCSSDTHTVLVVSESVRPDHRNCLARSEIALQKDLPDIRYSDMPKGSKAFMTTVSKVHVANNSFFLPSKHNAEATF